MPVAAAFLEALGRALSQCSALGARTGRALQNGFAPILPLACACGIILAMEKFELDKTLAEEIRARVLGDGFMKLVQSVRRNGKAFRISLRPVLIGGETRYQAEMNDEGHVRV